jgi:dTDP-4-dehydrorhamnose reductase
VTEPLRILLTGANGQVGTEFQQLSTGIVTPTDIAELDLTSESTVRAFVRDLKPHVIVNAAAYTAVDLAETNRDVCFAINVTAPAILAEEAARLDSMLIHYSTDYVFDGTSLTPYVEYDPTNPLSVYGESKAAGEQAILAAHARALILRTSWVYSVHGKNFLLTMLRLAAERSELRIVDDQIGAPTSAKAIAAATARLIELHADTPVALFPAGIFHMTAAGATSWAGFARAIFAAANLPKQPTVIPIQTVEYPTPASRPLNSRLDNTKFAATFAFRLPPWQHQLTEVLSKS